MIVAATKGDKQSPSNKLIAQDWRAMVPNIVWQEWMANVLYGLYMSLSTKNGYSFLIYNINVLVHTSNKHYYSPTDYNSKR